MGFRAGGVQEERDEDDGASDKPALEPSRVLFGFIVAPIAPLIFLAVLTRGSAPGLALLVGVGATLLLGVPSYFILRRWLVPTWWLCTAVGAAIATVAEAATVAAAFPNNAILDLIFGLSLLAIPLGAIGGLTFWAVAVWTPQRSESEAQPGSPPARG